MFELPPPRTILIVAGVIFIVLTLLDNGHDDDIPLSEMEIDDDQPPAHAHAEVIPKSPPPTSMQPPPTPPPSPPSAPPKTNLSPPAAKPPCDESCSRRMTQQVCTVGNVKFCEIQNRHSTHGLCVNSDTPVLELHSTSWHGDTCRNNKNRIHPWRCPTGCKESEPGCNKITTSLCSAPYCVMDIDGPPMACRVA